MRCGAPPAATAEQQPEVAVPSTETSTHESRLARIEARLDIHELLNRYAILIDDHDFEALGRLFDVDASFGSPGSTTTGRDAITAMYAERGDLYPISLHVVHGQVLEFDDDDHARGTVLAFSEQANAEQTVITQFRYHDEYVRFDGQWLFGSRRILTLYAMTHAELAAGGLTGTLRKRWPHRAPAAAELPVFLPPGT
jgi:SnoaL-like domain